MMATVSELSMLQAHSMKYKADKESLEQVVQDASDRLQVSAGLDDTSVYHKKCNEHSAHGLLRTAILCCVCI